MENINDSLRKLISENIGEEYMTIFYTSISLLWEKVVKKCELDTVFFKGITRIKNFS